MLNPTPAADCVASGSLAGSAALIVTSESDGYEAVSRGEAAKLIDGWRLDRARELGATAIKILVQQPLGSAELRRLDRDFVLGVHSTCRELDLCIVLEVLVPDGDSGRGADWSDALVRAAAELSPYCDLYKTSFPELGDDPERGREACARLTAESAAPWVVLSGGASPGQFERRLEIACREGASGFLAGRSVWGDALAGDKAGRRARLRELAVTRLERYGEIADRAARPWRVQCAEELGHDLVPAPGRFVPAPLALVAERKGGR